MDGCESEGEGQEDGSVADDDGGCSEVGRGVDGGEQRVDDSRAEGTTVTARGGSDAEVYDSHDEPIVRRSADGEGGR